MERSLYLGIFLSGRGALQFNLARSAFSPRILLDSLEHLFLNSRHHEKAFARFDLSPTLFDSRGCLFVTILFNFLFTRYVVMYRASCILLKEEMLEYQFIS